MGLEISTVGGVVDSSRTALELVNASSSDSTIILTSLNEALIDSSAAAAMVNSSSTALRFIDARTLEQTTLLIESCHDRGIDFRPNSVG